MVDHLEAPAVLRVLVLHRVEAVRALRDDLGDAHAVERLDVLHRQHLEQVLVAERRAGSPVHELARAEDREVDAGSLQQLARRRGSSSCCGRRSSRRSRPSRGTRGRVAPDPSTMSMPSRSFAQSARSPWFIP